MKNPNSDRSRLKLLVGAFLLSLKLCQASLRQLNAEFSKKRVVFQPFLVELAPTCSNLTTDQTNQLYISFRDTFFDYFYGKALERGNGLSLDFVAISNIMANLTNATQCTSTITVGDGVVAWDAPNGNTPTQNEVDDWARAAVQDQLLDYLSSGMSFITSVQVGIISSGTSSGNNSGTGNNGTGNNNNNGTGNNPTGETLIGEAGPSSSSSSKSRLLVLASIIVASFCLFALGCLFFTKARNKACVYPYVEENSSSESHATGSSKSPDSEEHQDISPVLTATLAVQQHSRSGSSDSHSLVSESSWTVNTEAGDSMALKSIAAGTAKPVNSWPTMSTPESFEYDLSKVNLRKDMLTSAWSGRMPSQVDAKNDSVLQPSHFSASQERRRRRLEDDVQLETASTDTPASSQKSQTQSSSTSPGGFVFSSANAQEDFVIMPPRPKARANVW